jgi:hypothetical protein
MPSGVELLDRLVPLFVEVLPPDGHADDRAGSCLAHLDLSSSYDLAPPARKAVGNFARPCINPSKRLPAGRPGSNANRQKAGSSWV